MNNDQNPRPDYSVPGSSYVFQDQNPDTTGKTKKKGWKKPALYVAGAFVLLGIGAAMGGGETDTTAPAPAVTITAAPEPAVTEYTDAATEYVTPAECLAALDDAEALNAITAEMAFLVGDHLDDESTAWSAAANFDDRALNVYAEQLVDFSQDVNALTERVQGNTFASNADACRSATS